MALTVLRKTQERVLQHDMRVVRGTVATPVAEYLLNFKRDDLNRIEKKYGTKVVIAGRDDVPIEEYNLEFLKTDDEAGTLIEDKTGIETGSMVKPWYKRLFPF
jgi:Ribonuclease G/E